MLKLTTSLAWANPHPAMTRYRRVLAARPTGYEDTEQSTPDPGQDLTNHVNDTEQEGGAPKNHDQDNEKNVAVHDRPPAFYFNTRRSLPQKMQNRSLAWGYA
jgi:hypothetical protein